METRSKKYAQMSLITFQNRLKRPMKIRVQGLISVKTAPELCALNMTTITKLAMQAFLSSTVTALPTLVIAAGQVDNRVNCHKISFLTGT